MVFLAGKCEAAIYLESKRTCGILVFLQENVYCIYLYVLKEIRVYNSKSIKYAFTYTFRRGISDL